MNTSIVVDGIPKVPEAKRAGLTGLLVKLFSKVGKLKEYELLGESDAFFASYETVAAKAAAIEKLSGFKLPPKFILKVNDFHDIFNEVDEMELPPEPKAESADRLFDLKDQYLVRRRNPKLEDCTEVFTFNEMTNARAPTLLFDDRVHGKTLTGGKAQWSTNGTYLITFHYKGCILWKDTGDNKRVEAARLVQDEIHTIISSADERFVCAISDKKCTIFNIKGKALRSFPVGEGKFKFSADGKFVGRIQANMLSIYSLPSCSLLDKRSVVFDNIVDFDWAKEGSNCICWSAEKDNKPGNISLIEFPSRNVLANKLVYGLERVRLSWQDNGEMLAAVCCVRRKKNILTHVEVFALKEKSIPVEHIDLGAKGCRALRWSPTERMFITISVNDKATGDVRFFTRKANAAKFEELPLIAERSLCNAVFWSPRGRYVVLAATATEELHGGLMKFYDSKTGTTLEEAEQPMLTSMKWDPSGRVVAACVSSDFGCDYSAKLELSSGYRLFSFQGDELFSCQAKNMGMMYSLQWRPRPKTLLSNEEIKEVEGNLKKYIASKLKADKEKEKRRKMRLEIVKAKKFSALKAKLAAMRVASSKAWEARKETIAFAPCAECLKEKVISV
eukprot:TRINITY_DN779823_c0_g1_i1.p1 TRINITY_DN779823_c0_g1~~TRINITY_DN779823_c0_g1_i1.p1  ORF type:complete len:627 (+),score=211.41 TRINITY_DN779823_c0_g1_i1:33-1883(+)